MYMVNCSDYVSLTIQHYDKLVLPMLEENVS